MVSKVDFEQRKNGQNMTFLVHHSGGTESLKQVARGLPSTSSRVPSEARISRDLLRAQDQQEIGNSELKGWSRF